MRDRNARKKEELKEIVIKDGDRSYSCRLLDLSATGMSVTTGHFIPTYKEVGVVMEIEGKSVAMKGSVRWSIDPGTTTDNKGKLGIFIIDPPPAFLDYVISQEEK